MSGSPRASKPIAWLARIAVAAVFCINVQCAIVFILDPAAYAAGFELSGDAGSALVRGLGVAFLMWNCTYPIVIWRPDRYLPVFIIVLVQQLIGLLGETFIWFTVQTHTVLAASIMRFILFDAAGFVVMGLALVLLTRSVSRRSIARGTQTSPTAGAASAATGSPTMEAPAADEMPDQSS